MLRHAHWRSCLLALLLLTALPGATGAGESCAQYDRFEAHASNQQLAIDGALNPFDPQQVQVDALFTGPGGTVVVQPCFWEIPQSRYLQQALSTERGKEVPWERFRDQGPGRWSVRFLPISVGTWQWHWQVRTAGHDERRLAGGMLTVTSARHAGPLQLAPPTGLMTSDGQGFIPVGINIAWPNEDGSQMFARYLDRLTAVGGNCARLWMVHYYGGTSLEWSHNDMNAGYAGVGHYSQEAAARVDALLDLAQSRDIRLMLCYWTFGDLSFDWNDNPYALGSPGGWLRQPADFFTDQRAMTAQRNLLRYAVARWSAYPSLGIWELWNEVDNCRGFDDAQVGTWHAQMAHELHRLDPLPHPITTSFRFSPPICPCSAFRAPDISLCESHTYWPSLVSAVQTEGTSLMAFGKPWQLGEFGMSDDPAALLADPNGLHVHDGMWASVFSGSVGGGFSWWWDSFIDAHDLWQHYLGISRFTHGESLADLLPRASSSDTPTVAVLERSNGRRLWAWVRNLRTVKVRGSGSNVTIDTYTVGHGAGAHQVTLTGVDDGLWQATWSDPYDGTWTATSHGRAQGGHLRLPVPDYRDDLALKANLVPAVRADAQASAPATPWHDELLRREAQRLVPTP